MDINIYPPKSGENLREAASSNVESYYGLIDYATNQTIDKTNVNLINTKEEYLEQKSKGLLVGGIKKPRSSDRSEGDLFDHLVLNLDKNSLNNKEIISVVLDTLYDNNHYYDKPQGGGKFTSTEVKGKKQLLYAVHDDKDKLHVHIHLNRHAISVYDVNTNEISASEALTNKYVMDDVLNRINENLEKNNLANFSSYSYKIKDKKGIDNATKSTVNNALVNNNNSLNDILSIDEIEKIKLKGEEILAKKTEQEYNENISNTDEEILDNDSSSVLDNTEVNEKSIDAVIKKVDTSSFLMTREENANLSNIYNIRKNKLIEETQRILDEKNILIQLSKSISLNNNYISLSKENEDNLDKISNLESNYDILVKRQCEYLNSIDDKYNDYYIDYKNNEININDIVSAVSAEIEDVLVNNQLLHSELSLLKDNYANFEEKVRNEYISNIDSENEINLQKEEYESLIKDSYISKDVVASDFTLNETVKNNFTQNEILNRDYITKNENEKIIEAIENKYKQEISALKNTNDILSKSNESLNKALLTLEDVNKKLLEFNNKIESKNDELNKSNDELSKSNDELSKSNDELNKSNDELNKSNDELNKSNERINSILDAMREKLINIFNKIKSSNNTSNNKELIKDVKEVVKEVEIGFNLKEKLNTVRSTEIEIEEKENINKNKPK